MRLGWNSAWGYQGSTSIGVRALRSPSSLFIGWRTENKPLRPLLRFRHQETPFAKLQGTLDAQSYVAAFRFNRYRAGYRQPSSLFVGWRTEKARRFSAGTCPHRPDITAAHCCHLCGHLPASPTNLLIGDEWPCTYVASRVRLTARHPHPSPFAPSPPVGALANRSVCTISHGYALKRDRLLRRPRLGGFELPRAAGARLALVVPPPHDLMCLHAA